jgi:hypothetical protein
MTSRCAVMTLGRPVKTFGHRVMTFNPSVLTSCHPVNRNGRPVMTIGQKVNGSGRGVMTAEHPVMTRRPQVTTFARPVTTSGGPVMTKRHAVRNRRLQVIHTCVAVAKRFRLGIAMRHDVPVAAIRRPVRSEGSLKPARASLGPATEALMMARNVSAKWRMSGCLDVDPRAFQHRHPRRGRWAGVGTPLAEAGAVTHVLGTHPVRSSQNSAHSPL